MVMESLSFPIKMAEGSEPKIVKPDHDALNINRDRSNQDVNDSSDTQEDTFAEHMQKEPDSNTRNAKSNRDRDRDITQTSKANATDEVVQETPSEGVQLFTPDNELTPTLIQFGEAVFEAPVEIAGAKTLAAALTDEAALAQEVMKARFIEAVRPEAVVLDKTITAFRENNLPAPQLVEGADEVTLKPAVQNTTPVLADPAVIKAAGATVVGVDAVKITPDLAIDKLQDSKGHFLKAGEFEILEKPELHFAKTAKSVTSKAAHIAPPTYMLAGGEPEIELKAMPSINEATATIRSVLSNAVAGVGAAAASQTTNAAAANAAAQVIAAIKADKNSNNIEVRLDPPELGRVRISFTMETADAVKAVLNVERAETLDHLRRNASQFIEDLKMAGFGSVDIEFSEQGATAFNQDAEHEGFDSDPSFISTQEEASDIVYLSLRDDAQLNLLV